MKNLKLTIIGMVLFLTGILQVQVARSEGIDKTPAWGPAGFTNVRYYYLPKVEAYYDIDSSMFIYNGENGWVRRAFLPKQFKSYDLYTAYKVVITDYCGETPYDNFIEYKTKYPRDYREENQKTIGNSPQKGNYKSKIIALDLLNKRVNPNNSKHNNDKDNTLSDNINKD
jgi:hypothetical protein